MSCGSARLLDPADVEIPFTVYMLMYIGAAEPIYSQSIFSPTIVRNLGKWTTSESLLLTVPRMSFLPYFSVINDFLLIVCFYVMLILRFNHLSYYSLRESLSSPLRSPCLRC
jgi:hypothetical protein